MAVLFFCALFSPLSFALQESMGPGGSNVQAVHALGHTGQGVSVGLISQDHSLITHEAFAGHAFCYNATDPGNTACLPSGHDTSVGGIICSRGGAFYPDDKGAAPDAELYSVKIADGGSISSTWIVDALDYLLDQQCQVVVTGVQLISSDFDPDGNSLWSLIYDYYAYEHNLIFATAAGNYEPGITVFGDTYNSITTGGLIGTAINLYDKVGSGSNPGPTADGRKKPDITAPSQSQTVPTHTSTTAWTTVGSTAGETSWSVPHTGGVAAVLLSYANESAELNDNQNEVIKAVIVNSAFPNIQDEYGTPTTGQVWERYRGYGRIDAKRAYDILSSPKITPSSSTGNSKGWAYDSVTALQEDSYTIAGMKNERLVVTLTWNRHVQWNDLRPRGTINEGELTGYLADLDLEIYDPDGILVSPAFSTIDNLEKIDQLLTKSGNYQVKVVNQSGSESADYALAFELLAPLEADFNIDYVVNDLDLVDFVPHWLDTDCNNPLQPCYSYNLSGSDSINLSDYSVFAQQWLTYDNRYYSP